MCDAVQQAVEAKVLDNLSEQTTAEKSAAKTAQDIKSLRKQGMYTLPMQCLYIHRGQANLNQILHALDGMPATVGCGPVSARQLILQQVIPAASSVHRRCPRNACFQACFPS